MPFQVIDIRPHIILGSSIVFVAGTSSVNGALFWAIFSFSGLGLATANYRNEAS